jgi:hypothetical protein
MKAKHRNKYLSPDKLRKQNRKRIELKPSKIPKNCGEVYFIGNLQYGFVKIGFSKNPYLRLMEIQTGCPFKLSIFFTQKGDYELESIMHNAFVEYRSHGEWFHINGQLENYIVNQLNK